MSAWETVEWENIRRGDVIFLKLVQREFEVVGIRRRWLKPHLMVIRLQGVVGTGTGRLEAWRDGRVSRKVDTARL